MVASSRGMSSPLGFRSVRLNRLASSPFPFHVQPVVNPPYFSYWAKDGDDYDYENFKPVAPADFPPPPEDDKVELEVPEEDIGDGPHKSFLSLILCLLFFLAFVAHVVLAVLACDTLDWCRRVDYSVSTDIYRFQTFPWLSRFS